MKPTKQSLFFHACGLALMIIGGVESFVSDNVVPSVIGLAGLTLIWLIALERDVYSDAIDKKTGYLKEKYPETEVTICKS